MALQDHLEKLYLLALFSLKVKVIFLKGLVGNKGEPGDTGDQGFNGMKGVKVSLMMIVC